MKALLLGLPGVAPGELGLFLCRTYLGDLRIFFSPTLLSSANGVKSVFPVIWSAELALKEPLCLVGPNVGLR